MFKEITRINANEEKVVSLVNTDDIAYVHELQHEFERTYKEDGSVATETQKPRLFSVIIVLKNQHHVAYTIDETQYLDLKKTLTSSK